MFACMSTGGRLLGAFVSYELAEASWKISYSAVMGSPTFKRIDCQATEVWDRDALVGSIKHVPIRTEAEHL